MPQSFFSFFFLFIFACNTAFAAANTISPKKVKKQLTAPAAVTTPAPKPAPTLLPAPERKWWYFNYFNEFTGPSADFHIPVESYSPALDFYAPMAIFHSISAAYVFETSARLGLEIGQNIPLQDDIVDRYLNFYSAESTIFDPAIYYQYYNFLKNKFSWVNGKVALDLPTSEFSRNNGYITGLYNGYVWNFRVPDPKHYFSLNFDFYLYFWENYTGWNRFAATVGHNWGYYFSPAWSIDTTTVFDFALIARGESKYEFTANSVDRIKITFRYQPIINYLQLGAFIQSPLYYRRLDRMAVGLNLNIWL